MAAAITAERLALMSAMERDILEKASICGETFWLDAVVALLRSTATGQPCPAALDPGVVFFSAPVQYCSGGSGNNNFYGKGLVNALAASR